jgi:hypothetical protein
MKEFNMKKAQIKSFLWVMHISWITAMCIVVIAGGVQHDYTFYLTQWRLAFSSPAIWASAAYGPIHLILAYAIVFGPLGPKILMCSTFLFFSTILFSRLLKLNMEDNKAILIYILSITFNGLIIFVGFWYGLNDIFVASFVLAAILARLDRKFVLMGILIGVAALIKYYPMLLLLFLIFDERCIRLRPLLAAISVFTLGIVFSWVLIGNSILSSIYVGFSRPPKLLSILSPLQKHPWIIGGQGIVNFLIDHNSIIMVCVAGIAFLLFWYYGLSWLSSFVAGTLAIFITYKIGHPQFYLPWLTSIAALPLLSNKHDTRTAWICMPFVIFLSVFQTIYSLGTKMHGSWQIVRDNVGFLVFPLGVLTIYFVVRQHRDLPNRTFYLKW